MGCSVLPIVDGEIVGDPSQVSADCCPSQRIIDGQIAAVAVLDITLPPSSFMTDARSSYDGAVGGTLASSYVAVPGTTNRVFYFTQDDGTGLQVGLNPANWDVALVGYTAVPVPLPAGLVTAQDVATELETAMIAFPEYTVTQIGAVPTASWQMRVESSDIVPGAFTGTDFSARGQAGLWGSRVAQLNTLPFGYGQGPVNACLCVRAVAPALTGTRVVAMDVFVGATHNAGDQFRLALYEGGAAGSDPTGAVLLYDFGQISGTATNTWVRLWVAENDVVTVGNATQLRLVAKSNVNLTDIGGCGSASGWEGDLAAENFWTSASMSADATVAFEPVFLAGGGAGIAFILGMRLIYEDSPYLGNGSWQRTFGVHEPIAAAASEVGINSQLLMGANPPSTLGMELDWIEYPYGSVHATQNRMGVYQGGAVAAANGAVLLHDFGQTAGAAVNSYVRINAPAAGASAVAVADTGVLWWATKTDDAVTQIRFQPNANPEVPNPPENPMDWVQATVPPAGDGSEYEQFGTNPSVNTDPTTAMIGAIVSDASDTVPGNYPFARLGLRINGITLVES